MEKKLLHFSRDTFVLPSVLQIHPISCASSFSSKLAFNPFSRRKVGVSLHLRPRRRSLPGVCTLMTWQVQRAAWCMATRLRDASENGPWDGRSCLDSGENRVPSILGTIAFPWNNRAKNGVRAGTIDRWRWLLA